MQTRELQEFIACSIRLLLLLLLLFLLLLSSHMSSKKKSWNSENVVVFCCSTSWLTYHDLIDKQSWKNFSFSV